jgi:hypothetical protein
MRFDNIPLNNSPLYLGIKHDPVVYNCTRGHIVCDDCKPRLDRSPSRAGHKVSCQDANERIKSFMKGDAPDWLVLERHPSLEQQSRHQDKTAEKELERSSLDRLTQRSAKVQLTVAGQQGPKVQVQCAAQPRIRTFSLRR